VSKLTWTVRSHGNDRKHRPTCLVTTNHKREALLSPPHGAQTIEAVLCSVRMFCSKLKVQAAAGAVNGLTWFIALPDQAQAAAGAVNGRTWFIALPDQAQRIPEAFLHVSVQAVVCNIGCPSLEPAHNDRSIPHVNVARHVLIIPLQHIVAHCLSLLYLDSVPMRLPMLCSGIVSCNTHVLELQKL
jgi:hypothetical protein